VSHAHGPEDLAGTPAWERDEARRLVAHVDAVDAGHDAAGCEACGIVSDHAVTHPAYDTTCPLCCAELHAAYPGPGYP